MIVYGYNFRMIYTDLFPSFKRNLYCAFFLISCITKNNLIKIRGLIYHVVQDSSLLLYKILIDYYTLFYHYDKLIRKLRVMLTKKKC